jgi:hypothetical protein
VAGVSVRDGQAARSVGKSRTAIPTPEDAVSRWGRPLIKEISR